MHCYIFFTHYADVTSVAILAVLWLHIFMAIVFIGGSFFIWLVVWPASFRITDDEKMRTRIVGLVAKRFAMFSHASVIVLIPTGLYLAFAWYLPTPGDLFTTLEGMILFAKMIVVAFMYSIVYGNNLYHGKKIMRLSKAGKSEELQRIRKLSHLVSYISLGLMVLIVVLAVALQLY